jgi:hypothetical protein
MPLVNIASLYAGERRGYSYDLLEQRIDTNVCNVDDFDRNTMWLGEHVHTILQQFVNGCSTTVEFKVGKTFVKGKSGCEFDPCDTSTWEWSGVTKRFSNYPSEYYGMVVFYAFTQADAEASKFCSSHRLDNQNLALIYERGVERWCKENNLSLLHTLSKTDGGGGMIGKHAAGYVLYVAVTMKDLLACKCKASDVEPAKRHVCKCLAVTCDKHKEFQHCGFCFAEIYSDSRRCRKCEHIFCEECAIESGGKACNCREYVCVACLREGMEEQKCDLCDYVGSDCCVDEVYFFSLITFHL